MMVLARRLTLGAHLPRFAEAWYLWVLEDRCQAIMERGEPDNPSARIFMAVSREAPTSPSIRNLRGVSISQHLYGRISTE